ncbi:hypothetical protein WDW89_19275 [Deltaproteobacteria bacterium TL4]
MQKSNISLTPQLEKAIAAKYESFLQKGEISLPFYLTYLSVEIQLFEHQGKYAWNLLNESEIAKRIEKRLQYADQTIQRAVTHSYHFWRELNIMPRLVNSYDIHPNNLLYGDLIFVHFEFPPWVQLMENSKIINRLRSCLQSYRKNNPHSILVAITDHRDFRLENDPLFLQWSYRLTKVKTENFISLLFELLNSPDVVQDYFYSQHTSDKMENLLRVQQMQEKVNRLQMLETDIKLLILIHSDLYDSYAEKIRGQLSKYHFNMVLVKRHTEFEESLLKAFDYFILFQCDFPELKELVGEEARNRFFRLEDDLSTLHVQPTPRIYQFKNKLEKQFTNLEEKLLGAEQETQLVLLRLKFQEYWTLMQEHKKRSMTLAVLNKKLEFYKKGYFTLIESLLLEYTKQVPSIFQFEAIMKNFLNYLIVDDFNPEIIDYLVSKKFPRHKIMVMNFLEIHDLFRTYKKQIPEQGPEAYQKFLKENPAFSKFELILFNNWNLSKQGHLILKLRIRRYHYTVSDQHPDAGKSTAELNEISLDVNDFLKQGFSEKMFSKTRAETKKSGPEGIPSLFLESLYPNIITGKDLADIAKIMTYKKTQMYKLAELEIQLKRLVCEVKELQKDLGETEDSNKKLVLTDLFAPLAEYNLKKLEFLALGCGISQLRNLEHLRTGSFLLEEARKTGKSALEILNSVCIRCVTKAEQLPEEGLRMAFPNASLPNRIHYSKNLPETRDFESEAFSMVLIDYQDYEFDRVVPCIKARNQSSFAHIPIMMLIPSSKKLDRHQETILEILIGLNVQETGSVEIFPVPYKIDSLENPQNVIRFVHEVLGITQLLEEKRTA